MNKYGMTLMEVIVSALILALTVGGTLYIFSAEKGVVARTGRQTQAMDFVRQQLEEFKDDVRADTWPGGTLQDTGGWTAWVALGTTGDFAPGGRFAGQGRRYSVTNIDANLAFDSDGDSNPGNDADYKQVEVEVHWSEPVETQ